MMTRFDVPRRSDLIDEAAAQLRGAARDLDARVAETTTAQVFYDDAVAKFEREKPRPGRILGGVAPPWEGQRDYDEALRKQRDTRSKLERLQVARRELEPKLTAAMALRHACEVFLKSEPMEGEPVTLRPARSLKLASDVHRQLENLRQEIAAAIAELEDVRRRPLPLEEALEVLERSIAQTAYWFRPLAGGLCAPSGETRELNLGEWRSAEQGGHVSYSSVLAAIFPDALRSFYRQRIEAHLAAHPPGLPREERGKRTTELEAQLGQAEQVEECIVRAMEARGLPVQRRGDAKPALVLAWSEDDLPPAPVAA